MLYDPNWKEPKVVDAVGQLMLKAADYLETHRWGQGDLVSRNGAVCLHGDLIKVETGESPAKHTYSKAPQSIAAYRRITIHLNRAPMYWNDDPTRKKHEVIALLREVAYKSNGA